MKADFINVIGGGLAGVEAAWQAARLGAEVNLYEMRPEKQTPAHRTDKLAEIVCSNSLKSDEPGTASYLLKEELREGGSLVMAAAAETRVPAGAALVIEQTRMAQGVWLPRFAHINLSVKVLLFGGGDYNKTIEWSDYKHFSGDVQDYKITTPAKP